MLFGWSATRLMICAVCCNCGSTQFCAEQDVHVHVYCCRRVRITVSCSPVVILLSAIRAEWRSSKCRCNCRLMLFSPSSASNSLTYIGRSPVSWIGISTGWMAWVRFPAGSIFFSSSQRPYRLWGPHSPLSSGWQGVFPGGKAASIECRG
jgi:hypothetical protein